MNQNIQKIPNRYFLFHWLFHISQYLRSTRLIVLNYHLISATTIRLHIEYLSRYFKFVDSEEFDQVFRKHKKLMENSILLTFDDGYRSFFTEVYPVLKDLRIPAIVFLPTSLVGGEELIWTDYLRVSILESSCKRILLNGKTRELNNEFQRKKVYRNISSELKKADDEKRKRIVEDLAGASRQSVTKKQYYLLTWDQVKIMSQDNIEFGSHSHTHPILSKVKEDQLRAELEISKKMIENETGKEVLFFAYPNGKRADYNQQAIDLLSELGYKYAFTTIQGDVDIRSNPYEIRRILLFDNQRLPKVSLKLLVY